MKNLSWNLFTITGDVDAYLLYKDLEMTSQPNDHPDADGEEKEEEE